METFSELRELVENPQFQVQKQKNLSGLANDMIDIPIVELINRFNKLPFCFTLQSCYGHFVYEGENNPKNLEALPALDDIAFVKYRIAYIAFCIDNSTSGRAFLEILKKIARIDPKYIQFCCAEWFWRRQVNAYVLQVEPDRFKHKDTAVIEFKEALFVEKTRNELFIRLYELLDSEFK